MCPYLQNVYECNLMVTGKEVDPAAGERRSDSGTVVGVSRDILCFPVCELFPFVVVCDMMRRQRTRI